MQQPPVTSLSDATAGKPLVTAAPRCRRCLKEITDPDQEELFRQTGLCFWCAYVDAQG